MERFLVQRHGGAGDLERVPLNAPHRGEFGQTGDGGGGGGSEQTTVVATPLCRLAAAVRGPLTGASALVVDAPVELESLDRARVGPESGSEKTRNHWTRESSLERFCCCVQACRRRKAREAPGQRRRGRCLAPGDWPCYFESIFDAGRLVCGMHFHHWGRV
jgi:hypothetical protein